MIAMCSMEHHQFNQRVYMKRLFYFLGGFATLAMLTAIFLLGVMGL